MNTDKIRDLIGDFQPVHVNKYLSYLTHIESEKDSKGGLKNPWLKNKTPEFLARIFLEVAEDGLFFDGQSITLISTGVSYNYQALKNKMLLAYPESIIDVGTVHEGDTFQFKKESGRVKYTHNIENPFDRAEKTIIGAYCVIKNSRGEFLTLLSKADIDKHRRVAKTDYIWKQWYMEMVLKTIMKKACKQHFNDIFSNIERIDNENYDLEKIVDESLSADHVSEIKKAIKNSTADKDYFIDWINKVTKGNPIIKNIEDIPESFFEKAMAALKSKAKK